MATNSSGKLSNSSFTVDFHRCGKCSVEYDSLEDFICHKITIDKCSLVLWESKKLIGIGLKIPSFMETEDCQKKNSDALLPACSNSRISFGHNISDKISVKKRRGRPRKYEKAMDKNLNSCLMLTSNNWECYPCNKTFPSCTTLDGHKAEKHKLSKSPEVICTDRVETKLSDIGHSDKRHDSLIIPDNISMDHELGPESSKESTCHKCGNKYKDSVVLKTHLKTVHCEMRPFKCKFDCPLSFKTKGSLMRHIRRHTGERPYKCKQCGRSFRESGALTRHLKSRFPCSTKTDNDLARYGKTVDINEYGSEKAGEENLLPGSIIKVIITDISDKPKDNLHEQAASSHIGCGLIIDKFGQEETCVSNEINSEQILQKTGESSTVSLKPGDTKVSVTSFESAENELTMDISSPKAREISTRRKRECVLEVMQGSPSNSLNDLVVENEDLKCVACMQNFPSKIDLKSHLMLHVGSLPFRCIQCCYVCQSKQELVKHQRRRHGIFAENPLLQKSDSEVINEPIGGSVELEEDDNIQNTVKQLFRTQNSIEAEELEFSGLIKKPAKHSSRCHICLKRFSGSLYLGCHMGIHTGEKPYSCSICKKSFFLKDSLKKHTVCHSEERKFRCGECYKSFKRLSHVRDHLRIHSLLCPYQCAKCGKAFRWQGTLKSHELSHGGPALRVHLCIVCGRRFPSKWSLVRHQRLHASDVTSIAHSNVHKSGVPDDHSHGKGKDLNGLSPNKVVNISGDSFMSQKQDDISIEDQVSSIPADGGTETYVLITQEDGSSCLVPTVAIVEEFQEETSTVNNIEDGYS